jgi:hypothetical protein
VVIEHESLPWTLPDFDSMPDWDLKTSDNDHIGERARGPHCECTQCTELGNVKEKYIKTTFSDYDNINPKEVKELSDHQSLLCMSHMFGFILADRTYGEYIIRTSNNLKFALTIRRLTRH